MTDHEWVQLQLHAWAAWASRRDGGAQGYPRINLLARERGRSASTDHVPVIDLDAERVDQAVRRLRHVSAGWGIALWCRYVGDPDAPACQRRPMTWPKIGTKLGRTDRTARTWVDEAERAVLVDLQQQRVRGVFHISGSR